MDSIQQILGNARYKMAPNADFNYKIHLEGKVSPLKNNLNKIISTLSAEQVFNNERNDSTKYRILGRLNLITDNSIFYTGLTTDNKVVIYPSTNDWDFLISGDDINGQQPNNWVLQMTYPSKIDKYSKVGTFEAYKGVTIKTVNPINPLGNKELALITTQQKSKLQEGDFCYIYSNTYTSDYSGFHQVQSIGENGNFLDTKLVLSTKYSVPDTNLSVKRVIDISDNDKTFSNPKSILIVKSSDITGGTTNANYVRINTGNLSSAFSAATHGLRKSDYIDLRAKYGPSILNGLHRVEHIIDRYNFVIDLKITNTPNFTLPLSTPKPLFRRLDGIPSDYYVRKFTLISGNDYEVNKATAFGNSVYPNLRENSLGVANNTYLFTFTKDTDTNNLYSHRKGPLNELNFVTLKRSGKNSIDWSDVTAHWDFDYSVATTSTGIETVSKNNPSGVGTIEKNIPFNSEYFGDFVEFNRGEILEKTISKIIHRFALKNKNTAEKGYYLDPFHKIYIRKFSNVIETAYVDEKVIGIPGNAELRPNKSLEWRDLLEPGYIEEDNNGVDYPFINGANYIYFNKYVYLRRQIPDKPPVIVPTTAKDPKVKC